MVVTVVLMFKNELCMVYLGVNGERISSWVVDGTGKYMSEGNDVYVSFILTWIKSQEMK